MYIKNLGTFDEVAAHYESIRPLKSKLFTLEQNLRPIGERRRTWERIEKISDSCYAFYCGGATQGDRINTWGFSDLSKKFPITDREAAMCAPIVWRKHRDGTETITVRNGAGKWQHNQVYSFIERALPRGLVFKNDRQGVQRVTPIGQRSFILPKRRCVPKCGQAYYEKAYGKNSASWTTKFKQFITKDDGLSLTFRRVGQNRFEIVGEPKGQEVTVNRVNVEEKSKYRDSIHKLRLWCEANYNLLAPTLSSDNFRSLSKDCESVAKEHNIKGYRVSFGQDMFSYCDQQLIRKILKDEKHPLQFYLGVQGIQEMRDMINQCEERWSYQNGRRVSVELTDEEMRKLCLSRFNRWINKLAGFGTKVKVPAK